MTSLDSDTRFSSLFDQINLILAVKGAEYQSVTRSLPKNSERLNILEIPAGLKPVHNFLAKENQSRETLNNLPIGVLLMGLAGSLSSNYDIGQVVLYEGCGYESSEGKWYYQSCDSSLTSRVAHQLGKDCLRVKGISSDQVITEIEDKKKLGERHSVDVVDMEGYSVLSFFNNKNVPVTIVRVISDNCQQKLPKLTNIFDQKGDLKPLQLAYQMIKSPVASLDLIQSSLTALKVLEKITQKLK